MPWLDQCRAPWESSRAGSDPGFLVSLHLSMLLIKAALSQQCCSPRDKLSGSTTSLTPQAPTTPHTLPSRHWLCFHLSALQFSCCCPIFSISSPSPRFPPESLPAHVSGWAYLDGAKHLTGNASSSGALRGPWEEKPVDKAGNLLLGFCTTPLSEPRPARFELSCPRQARAALCREGSLSIPTVWGRAGGCQAELVAIHQRLPSPSSQPDPWAAHLEPAQISRGSLCVQCK